MSQEFSTHILTMDIVKQKLIESKRGPSDAVMFDIDDTLIDSDSKEIIYTIYNILKFANKLGYIIVIITARPSRKSVKDYTRDELRDNGIFWDRLFFASPRRKDEVKKNLGYRFVLSVGDRMTDLTRSEYILKLPAKDDPTSFFQKRQLT